MRPQLLQGLQPHHVLQQTSSQLAVAAWVRRGRGVDQGDGAGVAGSGNDPVTGAQGRRLRNIRQQVATQLGVERKKERVRLGVD